MRKVLPALLLASLWVLAAVSLAPSPSRASGPPAPPTTLIADTENNRVLEVGVDGSIVWQYAGPATSPLSLPMGASRLENGNTLITDRGNHRVIEVTPEGAMVWQYGGVSAITPLVGALNQPRMAARLANGNTLIADTGNGRVLELTPVWELAWQYTALAKPAMAEREESGTTLITDTNANRIIEVDPAGRIIWQYATGLARPQQATLLADDHVLITDCGNHRVFEVDRQGNLYWQYGTGTAGSGANALSYPTDAQRLPDGETIIADTGNHRIIVAREDGTLRWQYGVTGKAANAMGYLRSPYAVEAIIPGWPPRAEADLAIRPPDDPHYVGEGVCQEDGRGQTTASIAASGLPAAFYVQVANAGRAPGSIVVHGSAGGPGWRARYYEVRSGLEITGQVTGVGWATADLNPGQTCQLRVMVSAGTMVIPGGTTDVFVSAGHDAVRATCQLADGVDFIIDNNDPTYTRKAGKWVNANTAPGYYGLNYQHDMNVGKTPGKSVCYEPAFPVAGSYAVYLRWPRAISSELPRASRVPVTITSANGVTTRMVNQREEGGMWVCQGIYEFGAGQSGAVEIRTEGSNGYVIADAVRFVQVPTKTVIDSCDPCHVTVTGDWSRIVAPDCLYGDALTSTGAGREESTIRFTPTLVASGSYAVYLRWPQLAGLSACVPVVVDHADGPTMVAVDQRYGAGDWVLVGVYAFNAGDCGSVTIRTMGVSGVVAADTLKLVKVQTEYVLDSSDECGVTRHGDWLVANTGSGYYGTDYLHDGNSMKGQKWVQYTPTLETPGCYAVLMRWPGGSTHSAKIPVDIISADGLERVTVDQRNGNGEWVLLGVHYFVAGRGGSVVIRTNGTSGKYAVADAVKFVRLSADIIKDNLDLTGVQIVGLWGESCSFPGAFGPNYLHDANKGKGSKQVVYTPRLPEPGNYTVYLRWTSAPDRASNVNVDITTEYGTSTYAVDQRINGGMWMPVGTYPFTADGLESVVIRTDGTNGYVIADAVRFVKAE